MESEVFDPCCGLSELQPTHWELTTNKTVSIIVEVSLYLDLLVIKVFRLQYRWWQLQK